MTFCILMDEQMKVGYFPLSMSTAKNMYESANIGFFADEFKKKKNKWKKHVHKWLQVQTAKINFR